MHVPGESWGVRAIVIIMTTTTIIVIIINNNKGTRNWKTQVKPDLGM